MLPLRKLFFFFFFFYLAWITAPDYYITIVYIGKTGVKLVLIQQFEEQKYLQWDKICSETFFFFFFQKLYIL